MKQYTTNNGKRTFSGVINPHNKENKITLFDDYNVNEIQQPTKPKGINNYLFKIMSEATNNESTIFKNL